MATKGPSIDRKHLMEIASLSRSLGAELYSFADDSPADNIRAGFSSVSIDSRTATEGSLFAALAGTTHDGHRFVEAAFRSGAAAALVESSKLESFNLIAIAKDMGKRLIAVDNTLWALQEAARVYLEQFPGLLKIGITGSSGKTTTKEITAAIIGAEKNTVMNPGNYNSETGLPLSVFGVQSGHEAGVFELGMNRRGEIAELASVLKPNIALITNIGSAHVGILGSRQAIAEEKKQIFSQFTGNEIALIPEDDEYRDFLSDGVKGSVRFYGRNSIQGLETITPLGLDGSEIVLGGQRIRFALPGKYNLANALAALALAQEVPVGQAAIRQGLETTSPLFGRGEILRGKTTVFRDCYNSNPESLEQALAFCDSLEWPGRKIYVVADMLELGDSSRAAHENMGRLLASSQADAVFLYGNESAAAAGILAEAAKTGGCSCSVFHTRSMEELSRALDGEIHGGEMVLLKGSRGCALEGLSAQLTGGGC